MYPSTLQSRHDYAYILNHSGATYCFISDVEIFEKINTIRDKVPSIKRSVLTDEILGCKTGQNCFFFEKTKAIKMN
jgi:long-subunit acyl-CoA synthetase (AMP-forming)